MKRLRIFHTVIRRACWINGASKIVLEFMGITFAETNPYRYKVFTEFTDSANWKTGFTDFHSEVHLGHKQD